MQKTEVIKKTENWIQSFIIDLSICPFAKREVERKTLRIEVSSSKKNNRALIDLYNEFLLLNKNPAIETTLLIFPYFLDDFHDYLDFLQMAENLIHKEKLEGIYQLASFHPQYCFADNNEDSLSNYTNRSPYPMLHLLREESVEKAIAYYGDTTQIPESNIRNLQELGLKGIKKILASC
ncbi:MAG: DUF1415 domain-containing protein [Proteobacteria bacterium]|nr:DUF1415 domain-containing protein [Pseudomonadota bacterium]